MKKELQDKLVDILGAIQDGVGKGSDFVVTQLPDIAQQYIAFGRVWTIVGLVFAIIFLSFTLYVFISLGLKSTKANDRDGLWPHVRIFSTMFGGIGTFFGIVLVAFSVKAVLLVWLAPKIWLLLEIAQVIKGF